MFVFLCVVFSLFEFISHVNKIIYISGKERSPCTFTVRGRYEYSGSQNTTCSGKKCQVWGSVNSDVDFPLDQTHNSSSLNSCRNPNLSTGGDWCFTVDDDRMWEDCCLPPCQGQ